MCFPLPWEIDGKRAPATSLHMCKNLYSVFSFQYLYTINGHGVGSYSQMRNLKCKVLGQLLSCCHSM